MSRVIALLPVFLLLLAASCSDDNSDASVRMVAGDLNAPRGLALSEDGDLLIAETGGGRVLEVSDDGAVREVAARLPSTLDSGPGSNYPAGPSGLLASGGELYVLVGEFRGDLFGRLYRLTDSGDLEPVTAPTSIDLPAVNRFSNPYDFIEEPKTGGWIVADSGRNALVAVSASGETRDYAFFEPFAIEGREPRVEVVPTGIARGPDGAVYVGSLTGFPYPAGEATVWRVEDINGDGDAMDDGEVEPHVTGLTTVTDITFGPDGLLYIAEFTSDMLAAIDGGMIRENVASYPGRVLLWDGGALVTIAAGLTSPTGLLVTDADLYISEEFAGRVTRRTLGDD